LDYSRLESGQFTLTKEPMELRRCVEHAVKVCAPASGQPVTVRVEISPAVPPVILADKTRLHQVLVNLLSNAVKFTPRGSITVSVEAETPVKNGQSVLRFGVTDTGEGIPADKFGLLFKPFSQIDSSSTRKQGGTGLGLAICKNLVHLMGGEIRVKSEVSQGSTFAFSLPLEPQPASAGGFPIPSRPALPRRVLVAQDHDLSRQLSLLALEKLGCHAEAAASGTAALERFEQTSYAAIIFEMQLSDMDGHGLASAIRERENHARRAGQPPVRLIALVSPETNGAAPDSASNINAFLHKSPSLDQLRQALQGMES